LLTSYNDYEVDSLGYLILYKRNGESWNQFTEIRGEGYYKYISRADFNAETGYLILRWTHEANREYSNDVIEESFDVFILNNTTGAFDFGTSLTFDGQYSNSSSNGGGSAYAVAVNNEFIGAAYTSGGYNYFSGLKLPMTDLRDILVGEGIGAVERGISMILRDDELFAGDPNYGSFYGAVMHYRYDTENNTWSYDSFIASDSLEIGAQFGWSLATDQDYLLVGAPQAAEKGAAFLFEEIEGSWILKKKFAPEEENIRGFGQDVDLDGSYIVIGASDVNANGKVFFFDLQGDTSGVFPTLPAPQNLNASDAEYIGYVQLEWEYTSDLNDGFVVYSDEIAIDTIRNAGVRRYQDMIPLELSGEVFSYYLKAFKVENGQVFESEPSIMDNGQDKSQPLVLFHNGLNATYYNDTSLTDLKLERIDPKIDFDWKYGSPHELVDTDLFSVRWEGYIKLDNGKWTFHTDTDDGVRLWVNNSLLINEWHTRDDIGGYKKTLSLQADQYLPIRMEYFENTKKAFAELKFDEEIIPSTYLFFIPSIKASDGLFKNYTRISWDMWKYPPETVKVESYHIYRSTPGDPSSGNEPIATVPSYTTHYSDQGSCSRQTLCLSGHSCG
jgi:hypothetical protein